MKKNMILPLAILLMTSGCGVNEKEKKNSPLPENQTARAEETKEPAPLDGSNIQGHYQAKFITLNPHVNGTIPGSANFYREDQKIFAYVRLFAGGVKAWHMQNVYLGERCPTINDDLNKDGFIDINEAEKVLGKILIPLDSDISSQNSGKRFFPLADLSGYYHYERISNFDRFLKDLQEPDKDLEDNIVKLPDGEGLTIVGKTFMVQGISETVTLPETVATKENRRSFQTLPVACGVFEKVTKAPGEVYVENEIPGPVAEVEEGQDRPIEVSLPEEGSDERRTNRGSENNESDDGRGPVSDGERNEPRESTEIPEEETTNSTEEVPENI